MRHNFTGDTYIEINVSSNVYVALKCESCTLFDDLASRFILWRVKMSGVRLSGQHLISWC